MAINNEVDREILLAFWKVHILHHASEEPVVGLWILRELRRHGYEVSPGTLYPMLARMARRGWLRCTIEKGGGLRARRSYTLTRRGSAILELVRHRVKELYREVVDGKAKKHASTGRPRRAVRTGRVRGETSRR